MDKITVLHGKERKQITLKRFDRLLHSFKLKFNSRQKVWQLI